MRGYVVTYAEKDDFYIPRALHIEKDTSCNAWMFETHKSATAAAERDGIELIYGMDHVPDGIYLDTEENRQLIEEKLAQFPQYKKLGINITMYIAEKFELLEDFEITITDDEAKELRSQLNEIAIDNYVKMLQRKYLA